MSHDGYGAVETGGLGVFEDEVKRLLGKRWVATGGALLRTNVNGTTSTVGFGALGGGSVAATVEQGHPMNILLDDQHLGIRYFQKMMRLNGMGGLES